MADEHKPSEHREPPPPDPPVELFDPAVYSYNAGLPCPFCGAGQLKACKGCEKATPEGGSYCIHCGEKK